LKELELIVKFYGDPSYGQLINLKEVKSRKETEILASKRQTFGVGGTEQARKNLVAQI
jgi:hypothetical protein